MAERNPVSHYRVGALHSAIRLAAVWCDLMSTDDARNTEDTHSAGGEDTQPSPEAASESPQDTAPQEAAEAEAGSTAAGTAGTEAQTSHTATGQADDGAAGPASGGGLFGGAGAVVSAGLGLCALLGTSLADMLRTREELDGALGAGAAQGGPEEEIEALFTAPWNTEALVNGIVGLVAVVIGVLAVLLSGRTTATRWVKPVALGGAVLGAVGFLIAGGMYLDLFGGAPEAPDMPQPPMGP